MSWDVFVSSSGFFLQAGLVSLFCGIPLILFLYKKHIPIDFLLVYIFGVLNLFFCLFIYANFNHFWDIRKFDVLAFVGLAVCLETIFLFWELKGFKGLVRWRNFRYFIFMIIVGLGIFYYFNLNYWDRTEKKFFNPGYGINHDHIVSLAVVKSYLTMNDKSTQATKNYYKLFKGSGYPVGGTYINMFFSRMFGADPYFVYQKVLVWLSMLNMLVVSYFVLNYFTKVSFFNRIALAVVSVWSVFNFLSLSMINSSVFASSVVIPFILWSILWTLLCLELRTDRGLFLVILFLTLIAVFFIYTCFSGVYYLLFILATPFVFGKSVFRRKFWFVVVSVFVLSFILPLNLAKIIDLFKILFTSTNVEVNLFKGMAGNTIGFVNPMLATGIWFSSPDYRFFAANYYNTWLVFSLIGGVFLLILMGGIKRKVRRLTVTLTLPFVLMVAVGFWVTKSPYQSAKTLQVLASVWPLVLFLVLHDSLTSKKWWLRMMTVVFLGIYSFYVFKSSVFAFSYIGKPIVKSNYELMKLAPEFCRGDENKLFLGRDEVSSYFLVDCKNINYYYDRFANNAAFWEIISLNKMASLDQKCDPDSLVLTKIDFSTYKEILIDKCFKFEDKNFRLMKGYDSYEWYERIGQ